MTTPRRSKTITFSLPPEMEAQVRQVMKEDDLSVSECRPSAKMGHKRACPINQVRFRISSIRAI